MMVRSIHTSMLFYTLHKETETVITIRPLYSVIIIAVN